MKAAAGMCKTTLGCLLQFEREDALCQKMRLEVYIGQSILSAPSCDIIECLNHQCCHVGGSEVNHIFPIPVIYSLFSTKRTKERLEVEVKER